MLRLCATCGYESLFRPCPSCTTRRAQRPTPQRSARPKRPRAAAVATAAKPAKQPKPAAKGHARTPRAGAAPATPVPVVHRPADTAIDAPVSGSPHKTPAAQRDRSRITVTLVAVETPRRERWTRDDERLRMLGIAYRDGKAALSRQAGPTGYVGALWSGR